MQMPQTVYVVMGNDFPECVYDSEREAEKFIAGEKKKDTNKRIYWRVYAFDVRTS